MRAFTSPFALATLLLLTALTLPAAGPERLMPGAVPGSQPDSEKPVVEINSRTITVRLSPQGRIVSALWGSPPVQHALTGETILTGCRRDGRTILRRLEGGIVAFQTRLVHDGDSNSCMLFERFSSESGSVRWEVEIRGEGAPWSTEIITELAYPATPKTRFWTAWSDPAPENRSRGTRDWQDPLETMPLKDAAFDYGAPTFRTENPRLGYCPLDGNLICLPLVSLLEPETDTGLSLVLSPEGIQRELTLTTTASGRITFSRAFHRIDARRPVKLAMNLVAHEADWRGSLRWMTGRYPQYFEPVNPLAHEMGGTAAYSSRDLDFDAAKMRKMAFRVNWRASFDFPYMGMFLPPVGETETWPRFGGQQTSLPAMRDYAAKMREAGFYVLSYFNLDEFGAHVTWPLPPRKAEHDEDLWKDCHDFLGAKLASAILRIPDHVSPATLGASIYPRSQPGGCYFTWEDGIVMDCGDPAYRDFLLDQARRHIKLLPQASGICIDRLDWMRLYNDRADDGESWFEGRPARSLMTSWNDLMDRLGPLMHRAGKVIFVNNHYKRLDLLRNTDGILDEFTYASAPLNLTALLTLRKPALGWTDNEAALRPDPDAFFQRYLHLGVYPMAPFPGNDHSLAPSPWVDQQYLDYGPLLDAMRGKQWVLDSHCVESATPGAKVNLFRVPGGYALPVTFGGPAESATVRLRHIYALAGLHAEALHPGESSAVPVVAALKDGVLTLQVPLKRGCAMVRLRQ